jgi:hypothetical protein
VTAIGKAATRRQAGHLDESEVGTVQPVDGRGEVAHPWGVDQASSARKIEKTRCRVGVATLLLADQIANCDIRLRNEPPDQR